MPSGTYIYVRKSQYLNALPAIILMPFGRMHFVIDLQSRNASSAISVIPSFTYAKLSTVPLYVSSAFPK